MHALYIPIQIRCPNSRPTSLQFSLFIKIRFLRKSMKETHEFEL